jgi:hypothetical protein
MAMFGVWPSYCIVMTSWNYGPNFGAPETAQQSKGIPEGDPPGQSARPIYPVNQAFPSLDHFYRMGGQTSEEGGFSFVYVCIFSWI